VAGAPRISASHGGTDSDAAPDDLNILKRKSVGVLHFRHDEGLHIPQAGNLPVDGASPI
jgi:hypothetical protein